ncbi:shortage in chiasmata 1 [Euphorbia peplus]|nr:shortage in chiasmata 1 [Euphorbia peplus]
MRTRFLNNEFFFTSRDETLSFLNLPIPHLPPPPPFPNFEQHLSRSDFIPDVSLEISRLPIDSALSKFLSQVLPQKIDVHCGSNEIWRPEEAEAQKAYGSEYLEEDNETSTIDNRTHRFEVIQFEPPELHESLGNICLPEESMLILSEIPEIENDPDSLRPGLKMQCLEVVQESVYAIDKMTVDYDMNKEAQLLEVDNFCPEQINFQQSSFPLLEVDEMSLRNISYLSMEDELLSSSENIDVKDNLLIDRLELLSFMRYDVLEFLGDHCLLKQHLEYDLSSMDSVLEMDIISLVERKNSEYCTVPLSPHVFQEFEFLELEASHIYEAFFAMQKPDEPETCDWMFRDNKNFKNFNELIVSCELALVDDTFKSMPIPILSDDNRIKSSYAVLEEMLAKIKPEPLSASDGIYLEWHLLEEGPCNSKVFSSYNRALEDFGPLNIDFDWETFGKGKELIDIILSDDPLIGPKVEECKESIHMFARETSSGPYNRGAPSKLSDDKYPKPGNGKLVTKANAEETSLLFKSMSTFNDLDFFLNPGKATSGRKCENAVNAPSDNTTVPKEGGPHSIPSVDEDMDDQKLKEVFKFLPTEDKHNVRTSEVSEIETCCAPILVPSVPVPYETKSEQTRDCMISFPETMIVVNIQNLDKEMIVSRRSTYQKILALEKEGLQVLERDLDLPVDIVIAPAICLVWYDCRNIRKKVTGFDEASSCLPLCIENIATNVLTLLSFSFSCCILIFEGDTNFISTVMECSDGLYAAAASLRIDLQLFCSYSSELTDDIILSNISYATKLCAGIYPKMPESETLAESFLTKFPSINPLTAHAILSSGGMLVEFLQWSNERRILEVQQFHVPEESISLFSALCSYGEREDSKSIMTDCSSSVSSGPDSKGHFNFALKPQKCISSPEKVDEHLNDLWDSGPLNQFPDDPLGPGPIKQDGCKKSKDAETLHEFASPMQHLSGQNQRWDIPLGPDSSTVPNPCNFSDWNDALVFDEIKRPHLYSNEELLDQNEVSVVNTKKRLNLNYNNQSENLHEEFFGEVIDRGSCGKKNIPSTTTNSTYFSTWFPETEEDSTRKTKAARRLSFGHNGRPTFPTAASINSCPDLWSSATDISCSLLEKNTYSDSEIPLKHSKKLLGDMLRHGAGGNAKEAPFKDEILHCGATPLSKAIQSTHSQPGSPWTIEFLNRIREKSKLRQQAFPSDASNTEFVHSGNTLKATKIRSPSILEFFKYKGGSNSGKMHEEKKQRQPKRMLSSLKSKSTSASFHPTWTPADKKSRQTLSFAMNDNGGQTRLVWSDGSSHNPSKKFRNQ